MTAYEKAIDRFSDQEKKQIANLLERMENQTDTQTFTRNLKNEPDYLEELIALFLEKVILDHSRSKGKLDIAILKEKIQGFCRKNKLQGNTGCKPDSNYLWNAFTERTLKRSLEKAITRKNQRDLKREINILFQSLSTGSTPLNVWNPWKYAQIDGKVMWAAWETGSHASITPYSGFEDACQVNLSAAIGKDAPFIVISYSTDSVNTRKPTVFDAEFHPYYRPINTSCGRTEPLDGRCKDPKFKPHSLNEAVHTPIFFGEVQEIRYLV